MQKVETSQTVEQFKAPQNPLKRRKRTIAAIIFSFILGIMLGILLQTSKPEKNVSPYDNIHLMDFRPDGWFDQKNKGGLQKEIKQNNVAIVIQVGSWMGKSALYMASLLPSNGKLYAVDTWQGEPTQFFLYNGDDLKTLYVQFLSNVVHANLTDKIVPVRMTSQQAARNLNVFPHLIYIDATHNYQQAMKDLTRWYPFVKKHGTICGDDYSWGDGGVGKAVEQFALLNNLKVSLNDPFWKLEPRD